jgi:hypothetical protein
MEKQGKKVQHCASSKKGYLNIKVCIILIGVRENYTKGFHNKLKY